MRIGIDGRLWNQTGVGRYIRNLVENLQNIDKKNEYVLFVRPEDSENVKLKINNLNWKIVYTNIKWHSLKEQYSFPKVLNRENLDLMHFPYFSVPIRYQKPFVVTIHDLILNHFPTGKASTLPLPLYRLKRIGYNRVINHAVKSAKKILVPLNSVKNDVARTFKTDEEKIVVTYEGVDKKLQTSNLKHQKTDLGQKIDNEKYFLYVGNAYPHKNLERLVKAFTKFKTENENPKDINLVLVGKDDYFYKRLERQVKNGESGSSIRFLHNVTDEDLSFLYAHALALVAPSLMEGFGLPVIEAISNGCPVLASNIPSFREVCKDTAEYFDPIDIDSIAGKLKLVSDKGKGYFADKIKDGSERLKLFSWEKMAEETLAVYEKSIK